MFEARYGARKRRSRLIPKSIANRNIRIAISGGGFRAALFALGGVLYVSDSLLSRRITEIRSVSGGSILNGVLAASGDVTSMTNRQLEEVAVKMLRTVSRRGLVLSSWLVPTYLGVLAVAGAAILSIWIAKWPLSLPWWQLAVCFVLLGLLLMVRGVVLQHLMWREFFRGRAANLGEVRSTVRHVFCASDLNSAEPVTFVAGCGDASLVTAMGAAQVPEFRLERCVRASAAFPGLVPPARLRLRRHGILWRNLTQRVPPPLLGMAGIKGGRGGRVLHFADGGVTNNLATDEGRTQRDHEAALLLVIDASAPLKTARLGGLRIPYLAELTSISRSMSVLYTNTVEPRIAELQSRGSLILSRGEEIPPNEDFPIVVRISDNTSDGIKRIRSMRKRAGLSDRDEAEDRVAELRRCWNIAAQHLRKTYGHKVMAARSTRVPTTFGRIRRPEAIALVLHGYPSTMISLSYAIDAPFGRLDIARFERLLDLKCGDVPGFASVAL